jgi:hypothetical protein
MFNAKTTHGVSAIDEGKKMCHAQTRHSKQVGESVRYITVCAPAEQETVTKYPRERGN